MNEGLIDANPFAAMKIKVLKGAYEEQDIHSFSKEERDLIIRTFASDRHYSHYTHYGATNFTNLRPPKLS